jgi:uncharacterized protein (UPF0332 family)
MESLLRKAEAAARSAQMLFEAGDFDGCANRAYYAMFDIARAYLAAKHGVRSYEVKTHTGLLSTFSRLGVKKDGLDAELGRALNQTAGARLVADYDVRSVDRDAAEALLRQMEAFVEKVRSNIGS